MATRVELTDDGLKETEIPDGQSAIPDDVQAVVNGEALSTGSDGSYEVEDATDAIIAELLGADSAEVVDGVEVAVGDKVLVFGIKRLSDRETSALLRKRMRTAPDGRIAPATDSDLILMVNTLHQCVRRKTGTAEAPEWVPMWTFEQVNGTPTTKGLIDNSSPQARELKSQLLNECYARNYQLNPVFLDAREAAITEQVRNSLNA